MLPNLEKKQNIGLHAGVLRTGIIIQEDHENLIYQLQVGALIISAKKAFSCLVLPSLNDSVLIMQTEFGSFYILQILDRLNPAPAQLQSEHGLLLGNINSSVGILCKEMDIYAEESIQSLTKKLNVHSIESTFTTNNAYWIASKVDFLCSEIKTISEKCLNIFAKFSQRTKDYNRESDYEEIQSKNTNYRVEESLLITSKRSDLLSKEEVRIDANNIKMG